MNPRHDIDIKAFKTILLSEKNKIEKNIDLLKAELSDIAAEDEIDDMEDMAGLEIDNRTDQALLLTLQTELSEIEAALGRIDAGNYGICEKTGKPIPVARLRANPIARTLVNE